MYCTYCGNEMPEDAVMCVKCGKLTPEYEASLKKESASCPAESIPVVSEPKENSIATEYELAAEQGSSVKKGDKKHISWIMSLVSITFAMFVSLVFAFMHDHYYEFTRFPIGAGILGIIGGVFAVVFSVLSCVMASKEKRKAQKTSEYFFPAALSLLFTLVAMVLAIAMLVVSMLYEAGYYF